MIDTWLSFFPCRQPAPFCSPGLKNINEDRAILWDVIFTPLFRLKKWHTILIVINQGSFTMS